jgi:hypothetical protein
MQNPERARVYGEMNIVGGSSFTIDTTAAWHMYSDFSVGTTNGLTSEAGTTGAITAFADAGGGEVQVTSAGHSISDGDYISITGTTNYNGLFQITYVDANNFKITVTWVSDDATGTWHHGAHLVVPDNGPGDYKYTWACSMTASANGKVFVFTIVQEIMFRSLCKTQPTRRTWQSLTVLGC